MTTLGVLDHGPASGYPFNRLFSDIKPIKSVKDVEGVNAVVLWGGEDISPSLYGQKPNNFCHAGEEPSKRDLLEWAIITKSFELGIPLIGVCRGAQILCAYDGGTLGQDIAGHGQRHAVITFDGEIFDAPGDHHQICLPGNPVKPLALKREKKGTFYMGENNTINYIDMVHEAFYLPDLRAICFQYHPEWAAEDSQCIDWTLQVIKENLL